MNRISESPSRHTTAEWGADRGLTDLRPWCDTTGTRILIKLLGKSRTTTCSTKRRCVGTPKRRLMRTQRRTTQLVLAAAAATALALSGCTAGGAPPAEEEDGEVTLTLLVS